MSDVQDNIFRALADTHRRQILAALCRAPMIAGDLARLVGQAPNAVSFHLKWLKEAGLVSLTRQGRFLCYQANAETLAAWKNHVLQTFPPLPPQYPPPAEMIRRPKRPASSPAIEYHGRPEPAEPNMTFPDEMLPTELL